MKTFKEWLFITEATGEQLYNSYFKNVPRDVFDNIVKLDQTTKIKNNEIVKVGKYGKQAVELYRKDEFDDKSEEARDIVSGFETIGKKGSKLTGEWSKFKNIHNIKTKDDLLNVVHHLGTFETKGELKKNIRKAESDIETYFENDEWAIIIPMNYKASMKWGRNCGNASWCTSSSRSISHFNRYQSVNDLYIFYNKKQPENSYQMGFTMSHGSGIEFNDNKNKPVELNKFKNDNVDLKVPIDNIISEWDSIKNDGQILAKKAVERFNKNPNIYSLVMYKNSGSLFEVLYKKAIGKIDLFEKILIGTGEDGEEYYSSLPVELLGCTNKNMWNIVGSEMQNQILKGFDTNITTINRFDDEALEDGYEIDISYMPYILKIIIDENDFDKYINIISKFSQKAILNLCNEYFDDYVYNLSYGMLSFIIEKHGDDILNAIIANMIDNGYVDKIKDINNIMVNNPSYELDSYILEDLFSYEKFNDEMFEFIISRIKKEYVDNDLIISFIIAIESNYLDNSKYSIDELSFALIDKYYDKNMHNIPVDVVLSLITHDVPKTRDKFLQPILSRMTLYDIVVYFSENLLKPEMVLPIIIPAMNKKYNAENPNNKKHFIEYVKDKDYKNLTPDILNKIIK